MSGKLKFIIGSPKKTPVANVCRCSKLREVPDNQEVWIDKDGFTSIIFDITERVGEPGSSPEIDGRAITEHLEDLVGTDIDTVKIWNTAETEFTRLEYVCSLTRHYLNKT